jgi:hypothetical protein
MEIRKLQNEILSINAFARQLNLVQKTGPKYLRQAPRDDNRKPKS